MGYGVRALALIGAILPGPRVALAQIGQTEITRWQYGKKAAVSLTYDDGTVNQFRVAVPLMDRFGFSATFFVITGEIRGSRYHGAFVGRPTETIIRETAGVPTSEGNFLERASALGFLGYRGTLDYHTRAGEVYDEGGDPEKTYQIIDEAYAKVRQGAFTPGAEKGASPKNEGRMAWDELSALAKRGYEFASHTITHPRLAVLDDANLVYELEKSRQDILDHLGSKHTFSVECPYGTENERVVTYALARYPLARNDMPDPFVEDLNRWNDMDPSTSTREYVRWQRGPLTRTPMSLMKSWVDTIAADDHTWLVLVFHGVDGVGWEPKTSAELEEYFAYLKSKEDRLWIATFQDVAKYMRERMHGDVRSYRSGDGIAVVLRCDLTDASYDLPLTLKTRVPEEWASAEVRQGGRMQRVPVVADDGKSHVLYQAIPNGETLTLVSATAGHP